MTEIGRRNAESSRGKQASIAALFGHYWLWSILPWTIIYLITKDGFGWFMGVILSPVMPFILGAMMFTRLAQSDFRLPNWVEVAHLAAWAAPRLMIWLAVFRMIVFKPRRLEGWAWSFATSIVVVVCFYIYGKSREGGYL